MRCSPTTIASSTTIPTIINPKRDIIFIDCPVRNITPKVAKKAIGIPRATQIAVCHARKRNKIINNKNKSS